MKRPIVLLARDLEDQNAAAIDLLLPLTKGCSALLISTGASYGVPHRSLFGSSIPATSRFTAGP
jgi:hypothetical protein